MSAAQEVGIIGAGLSGLIAAHAWPRAHILEAQREPSETHKAVLRFRTREVAALTGVEFREVSVRKAIWMQGSSFTEATPALANMYSAKVLRGRISDRSVWDLRPVTRYVAPPDFYAQLVDAVESRIHWGMTFDFKFRSELRGEGVLKSSPIISTAPLHTALTETGLMAEDEVEFRRSPIKTYRWRIEACDVHQTVYFPDPALALYRASITGDTLMCECVDRDTSWYQSDAYRPDALSDQGAAVEAARAAFGLRASDLVWEGASKQAYGKIAPIDELWRRQKLRQLTEKFGIYSLGRFATWRNVILDDLIHDIAVIKRMVNDDYAAALINAT